jgi:phosphoribosylformylglycinamidine cyclo-ligase
MVRTTYNPNVLSDLGSFGGLYQVDLNTWKKPVLVSSADGVGTKLRLAIEAGIFDTVGQDLVNHCVNDILVQGAIPQFFLDYIGVGELLPAQIEQIISGFVKACRENSCVLIGGEMAEMPGIYQKGDFDLAGTIIGMVEKDKVLTGAAIQSDDVLIGIPSSGLHTNGYSLARKILADNALHVDSYLGELEQTVAEAFLSVHRSYLPMLKPLLQNDLINGMAHITGGGIPGNLSRIIPTGLTAWIDESAWEMPALFHWLKELGNVEQTEMRKVFNNGIGMILAVAPDQAETVISAVQGIRIGNMQSQNPATPHKVAYL